MQGSVLQRRCPLIHPHPAHSPISISLQHYYKNSDDKTYCTICLSLLAGEQGSLLVLDTGVLLEQRTVLGTWKCSTNVHLLNRVPHRTNMQQMLDVCL